MREEEIYTKSFFEQLNTGSQQSARETVLLILELVQPKSVVDVGCGNGNWLSVFNKFGIQEILGIDGDYVDPAMLMIPAKDFLDHDLKLPLQLDRKFDLVVSLEVAEYLPSEFAEVFINYLTKLGPVVLFSAAIPFQGGTGHVNEQWTEYWIKLFKKQGYVVIDCLREKLWDNKKVEPYYAQNIFIFVKQDCLELYPRLAEKFQNTKTSQLSLVHPGVFLSVLSWIQTQLINSDSPQQAVEALLKESLSRPNHSGSHSE